MGRSERKVVLLGKKVRAVERTSQPLKRCNPGVLVGKLRRDPNLAILDQSQRFVAPLPRAPAPILVQNPLAIEPPTGLGYLSHQTDPPTPPRRSRFPTPHPPSH